MSKALLIAAAFLVLVAGGKYLEKPRTSAAPTSTSSAALPSAVAGRTTTPPIVASACLDQTGSTASGFQRSILTAVIEALASWYPIPASPQSGEPATASLRLSIFPVTQASTKYGVLPFRTQLPALGGLSAMPTSGGNVSDWLSFEQNWLR